MEAESSGRGTCCTDAGIGHGTVARPVVMVWYHSWLIQTTKHAHRLLHSRDYIYATFERYSLFNVFLYI